MCVGSRVQSTLLIRSRSNDDQGRLSRATDPSFISRAKSNSLCGALCTRDPIFARPLWKQRNRDFCHETTDRVFYHSSRSFSTRIPRLSRRNIARTRLRQLLGSDKKRQLTALGGSSPRNDCGVSQRHQSLYNNLQMKRSFLGNVARARFQPAVDVRFFIIFYEPLIRVT